MGFTKLTKNADLDKYKYSDWFDSLFWFDSLSEFSLTNGSMSKTFVIFGVDMSSSVHINNKDKDILILAEGPTQWLDKQQFLFC